MATEVSINVSTATIMESTDAVTNTTDVPENTTDFNILEPETWEAPEATIVPILFVIIFLAGVIGNSALIYTVLRNKNMRNTPNIFVVSLSIGDMLLLLCSVPFAGSLYTITSWPFGQALCKFNEYMQTFSLGVSVFTLTALSGDRYIAIVHPMSKHMGKPTVVTTVTVIVIWWLALILAIPDGYTSTVEYFPTFFDSEKKVAICSVYPKMDVEFPQWYPKAHSMFRFVIFFLIPLLIIGVFYISMARILVSSSREIPCETIKNSIMNQQQKRQVEARLKVAKIVLSFVIIFIICWLPRHIYLLFFHYSPAEYNMFWHVFKITGFCLTYIYSCVNPYALYFLSSQFRRHYNRYLFCCCPKFQYRSLGTEQSTLYNFNSTVRRGSSSLTGVVHSQSMC